jgi:hypothetical protein
VSATQQHVPSPFANENQTTCVCTLSSSELETSSKSVSNFPPFSSKKKDGEIHNPATPTLTPFDAAPMVAAGASASPAAAVNQ